MHFSYFRYLNLWIIFCFMAILQASEYYVATYGSDDNIGSFDYPFGSVQRATESMVSGDICYIRQGVYHEIISLSDQDGTIGEEIIFTNFNSERVVFDGTVLIDAVWQVHSGDIWKTSLDFDIWQLFVNRDEMVMARWPNANFEDGSIWDKANHWGHGLIDQDEEAYENGTLIDEPHGEVNLSESGLNIVDAIAILNVGSYKTWTRKVLSHSGNTFTYDPVPEWKTKHHDYYLEGKLDFLDVESEWFYDPETGDLYFYPPAGVNPNEIEIRGKTQSYAFEIINSDYVTIKDLEFFGTTFRFHNSDYGLVEGCNLFYPSCYKRMLGVVDTIPDVSVFTSSSYCRVYQSAFRYTDGSALEMYSGNNIIEDCYFYHIDHTATDLNGLMTTIQMGGSENIFRRNTLHKLGASATLNPGNEALIELNDMSDSGYMQSDGSLIQCMVGQQPGVVIRFNWLHDTIKYGARFDGNGAGNNGLMHHNVIWNVQGGIMVKGYEHSLYNNTAFDNGDKNDIIVMIDQGGNEGTITRNNAANKIAGHRSGTYEEYPVPGIYDHNWNGYETGGNIKNHLMDPENLDFRPRPDSALVDAGMIVEGITELYGFSGDAPDLGAYEHGGEMWVPGITWDVSTTFGDDFMMPESINDGPVWYVSNFGSNTNDGSLENPFLSIQYAYIRAGENDTIIVHPGTFNGAVWLYQKNVILGSLYLTTGDTAYIDSTIIDGSGDDCNVAIVSNIDSTTRVTGFTIRDGVGCVYGQGGGIYVENSSPRLDHLIIKDNVAGTAGGGICLNGTSNALISEVIIENNTGTIGGGGIHSYNSVPVIKNCIIQNNHSDYGGGIYLMHSSPIMENISIIGNSASEFGGGISCVSFSAPSFDYLTMVNNTATEGSAIFSVANSFPTFLNSIIWNNTTEAIVSHEDSLMASYSNIDGGWEGVGNLNEDPLFCLADSGVFTLAENSPCVGSGENGVTMGAFGIGCDAIIITPSEFSLLYPENNYQLIIDESNQDQSLIFSWEEAVNNTNDSLAYTISFQIENLYGDTLETNQENWEIPYEYFITLFSDSALTSALFYWDVTASYLDTSFASSNGPFVVSIEVSELLLDNNRMIPSKFELHQNYPNPFNPLTEIRYDLPNEYYVSIIINDLIGREIKYLVNKVKYAGYHSVRWNGTNNFGESVSAGMYIYTIQAGELRQTKKMILLK